MRKFAGLLVLFLTAIPGWTQEAAQVKETPQYYPLNAGMTWHYRLTVGEVQQGRITSKVAKIEKIDDQTLARVEVIRDGKVVSSEHLSSNASGVFRHRINGIEASPAVCVLKYPIKEGDSWESKTQVGTEMIKVTSRGGSDTVEVPAGKYKAVTVQAEAQVGEIKITTTYWFVPRIGVVKQVADFNGMAVTLELEKFEAGK